MKKIIISSVCFFLSLSAMFAQDRLSSRFELHAYDHENAWLHIYLVQAEVHEALVQKHPEMDFTEINPDAYKMQILRYIKEHISLKADNTALELGDGTIELGYHQTELKFQIKNYPEQPKQLNIDIDAFKENEHQYGLFWWLTSHHSEEMALSSHNNFKGQIDIDGGAEIAQAGFINSDNLVGMLLIFEWLFLFAMFTYKKSFNPIQSMSRTNFT